MKPMLTVFTPTYNRAHLLGQSYESLKRQTCKDFIWLIIDDGSSDDTKTLV
ncbi:MAG: glycosyltransferase, partial [Niameybacter sp.]